MYRLKTMALIACIGLISILTPTQPVEAVTADSITPLTVVDMSGDCTRFMVEVSIANRVAAVADAGVLDYYYVVVYDGDGSPHYSDDFAAQVPSSAPTTVITVDETFHEPVTSFPLRVVMYDVDVAATQPLSVVESSPVVISATFTPDVTCGAESAPTRNLNVDDERENTLSAFPYQPVAVYCQSQGRIDVYAINEDSRGYLVITVTGDEIKAIGTSRDENLLIAESDDVRLYRLTTGEFQVNALLNDDPNGYVFTWEGCFE